MTGNPKGRLCAIACSVLCAATVAWMFLCDFFRNTYFRPLHSEIKEQGQNAFVNRYYDTAVECGVRFWQDAFIPSTFTLLICMVFLIFVAVKSQPSKGPDEVGAQ